VWNSVFFFTFFFLFGFFLLSRAGGPLVRRVCYPCSSLSAMFSIVIFIIPFLLCFLLFEIPRLVEQHRDIGMLEWEAWNRVAQVGIYARDEPNSLFEVLGVGLGKDRLGAQDTDVDLTKHIQYRILLDRKIFFWKCRIPTMILRLVPFLFFGALESATFLPLISFRYASCSQSRRWIWNPSYLSLSTLFFFSFVTLSFLLIHSFFFLFL
jgi:hypothetical protein